MKVELEHKLCKRFPWLYVGYGGDIRSEGLYFGLQHGDGWFDIIWMLSLALEEEYKKLYPWYKRLYHRLRPNASFYPRASQVKEKYGTLSYYMTYSIDEMDKFIDLAGRLSSEICEQCGKSGKTRGKYWYYTACKEHSKPEDLTDYEKESVED